MSVHRRRSGKRPLGYKARGDSVYGDQLGASAPERKSPGSPTQRPAGPRGPNGEQQRELAELCRSHGIDYPSRLTATTAAEQIRRLRLRPVDRGARDRVRGPSGEQQKELAALCRLRGIEYPSPKTAAEAADQLARLRDA